MTTNVPNDFIWGVSAIADYIKRPPRAVYHLIAIGAIPIKKLGARTIVARASEIDKAISGATNKPIPKTEPKASPPRVPKRLRRRITAHGTEGAR
jgi:hypothetical protein